MAELKREEILSVFEKLKRFMKEVGMEAVIFPESEEIPIPTLVVGVKGEEEFGISVNHLPISDEESRYTVYYHFYAQLPLNIAAMDELTIMRAINVMNQFTSTGHFLYLIAQDFTTVQMRYTLAVDEEGEFTGSLLYEIVDFMMYYCSIMYHVLIGLAGGMSLEDAFAAEGVEI